MVCFHFLAAHSFSQIYISSCEQSACPCEADVHALFNPQRPWWASNTERNWYHIGKVITGWEDWSWIYAEAWKIIREHQEGISRSTSLCYCKLCPSQLPLAYDLGFHNRGHGTRISSSNSWWNKSSHVTSHLKKWKGPNSSQWWIIHIAPPALHWRFQNKMASSSAWWRWAMIQLRMFARCFQYDIIFTLTLNA